MSDAMAPGSPPAAPPNPIELLRSRGYLVLLIFAAILGVPIAFVAYWFLAIVSKSQHWLYQNLPVDLGFAHTPTWWPLPLLVIAGAAVRDHPLPPGHRGA